MNTTLEKTLCFMIYGALMVLALGLVTSVTILSFYHILLVFPIIYFLSKTNFKKWTVSTWALVLMSFFIILSTLFNQDIATTGYKPLGKVKYFIFGFLSIAPITWYFKNYWNDKKISYLLYVFCFATMFATLSGIISLYFGFNYVTWREVSSERNAGLFGMVMNYAHNLAYFQIIIGGLLFYKKETMRFININFLYIVFTINLVGLYLTYTRGAWLGFLVALPFFLFKKHKKVFIYLVFVLILFGSLIYKLAGDKVVRLQSNNERLSQWQAAVEAVKERPILGYGYLNFEQHSVDIKKRYNIGELQFGGHAHSNVFEMLGSVGGLGFISFIVWIVAWFIEMYKRNDATAKITLPFVVVLFVGGLTQSTISLGVNLFFIMSVYSLGQVRVDKV